MKQFSSYGSAAPYQDTAKLPPDGYVIGIIGAEEKTEHWGTFLEIKFDICEGEWTNFYSSQYKSSTLKDKKYKGIYRMSVPREDGSEQDEWTARRFKTDMLAIEESNPGFTWDWDERKLIGRKVGVIFFQKEYEFNGRYGMFTAPHSLRGADKIREGDFKIPEPKLLKNRQGGGGAAFPELDVDVGELPF